MKQDFKKEIAIRDQLICALEREGRLKDELIQSLKEMIQTLEVHNAELQQMIEKLLTLQNEQKG